MNTFECVLTQLECDEVIVKDKSGVYVIVGTDFPIASVFEKLSMGHNLRFIAEWNDIPYAILGHLLSKMEELF